MARPSLTVKFVANDNPVWLTTIPTQNRTLSIKIGSYGSSDSHAAFGLVQAYHYDDGPITTAPTPSPIEDEPITTALTPGSDEPERCYNDKEFRLNGKRRIKIVNGSDKGKTVVSNNARRME